jgi:hypothetical protein
MPTLATILSFLITSGPSLLSDITTLFANVKSIFNKSTGSTTQILQQITTVIPPTLAADFTAAATPLFPKLPADLAAAAALLHAANTDMVSFCQEGMNLMVADGVLSLPITGKNGLPLDVDGVAGTHTIAAAEILEAKIGIPVSGVLGQELNAYIGAWLMKIKLPS